MELDQAHNLIGEFLNLIGVLFVDLGQSHNPIGALMILSGEFCLWEDG